jgi:tetratricopeptide (TPR) repeat protein
VAGAVRGGRSGTPDTLAERALSLVMADPRRARTTARAALAAAGRGGSGTARVVAYRALGLATRELHDASGAAAALRRAVDVAQRRGLDQQAAEARMSLALVLDDLGRPAAALREIDRARAGLSGVRLARATMQRAIILRRLGRDGEALDGYRAALGSFRRHGDRLWQARTLTNRGVLHAYRGAFRLSVADLRAAEHLYGQLGLPAAVAQVRHNLGFSYAQAGDVPAALSWYDRADLHFRRTGSPAVALIDRAELLLEARLLPEARAAVDAAVAACQGGRLGSLLAQARLLLARVALAAGDAQAARSAAAAARRAFARQGRDNWAALARYVEVVGAVSQGRQGRAVVRSLRAAAQSLAAAGWVVPAWDARLDAAQLAIRLGDLDAAGTDLAHVSGALRRGSARLRARVWHVRALLSAGAGDPVAAKRAVAAGMREVDAYRATLGAAELRTHSAAEATELASLRLRMALADRRPRQMLAWAERWRAAALRMPPPRPSSDPLIVRHLAELRRVNAELFATPADPQRAHRLLRRQRVLEDAVRRRTWRSPGTGWEAAGRPAPVPVLAAALGERVLVELVALDGVLHALVVVAGRVRHRVLGDLEAATTELIGLRFAVRRLVLRHGSAASLGAARAALVHAVGQLDRALLAPLADLIADRPLVLAPTGVLHGLPWAMLPGCRSRPTCVVPSATAWWRATQRPDRTGGVVLVAGPAPEQAVAEVTELGRQLPGARLLTGGRARADDVLAALDGAGTGHVASHGEFRADNPLFSHLRLADGPLTVHDLSALRRPPALLVLSACDSGLSAVHPGDELMGLSAALLGLDTRAVVASTGPVDDVATRDLMVDFHRRLAGGTGPAAALAAAQAAADPDRYPSTHSFLCLGAG